MRNKRHDLVNSSQRASLINNSSNTAPLLLRFRFLASIVYFASILVLALSIASAPAAWANQQESMDLTVAGEPELMALSDEELGEIAAGDVQMTLEDLSVFVQNNEAGYFTMDIAQNAFDGAQGVFTTLQTVNSAIDLNVVVNIYLSGSQFSQSQ